MVFGDSYCSYSISLLVPEINLIDELCAKGNCIFSLYYVYHCAALNTIIIGCLGENELHITLTITVI